MITIILWTIQREDVLQDLSNYGVRRITDFTQTMWCEEDTIYHTAYDWMYDQMCEKVSKPPLNVKYPIWAWHSYDGKRKKPDMRFAGFEPRGTPIVRITLDIPEEDVLLSDYNLWHFPLNNWYLPISEDEELQFDKLDNDKKNSFIKESWQHIYNLDAEDDGYTFGKKEDRMIQATFWELKEEYIISIEKFIAK